MQNTVEYELKKTVTGDITEPKKQEKYVMDDGRGHILEAPHAPNPKCNKCAGRGYVALNVTRNHLIPCKKCYKRK